MKGRRLIAEVFVAFAIASIGCGGRVIVDGGEGGASTGSASGGAPGTGGGLASCDTLGYVAEGAPCDVDGDACAMTGACAGVRIVCVASRWKATPPLASQKKCAACGAHLFCTDAAICIEDDVAEETAFTRCAPDPCPGGTGELACSCAGLLCPMEEPTCQTVDNAAGPVLFCARTD